MSDPLEILTSRGLTLDAIEARGYSRYESADDVITADARMGSEAIIGWTRSKTARRRDEWGQLVPSPGWLMPKHKLPGSAFDDPLPQLRPDAPVPDYSESTKHDHAVEFLGRPLARAEHEHFHHEGRTTEGLHRHVPVAKYLLTKGPHGKRWDTSPLCSDRFKSAERVFLHLEGCIKCDALASAGEAVANVPSVTLWERAGALSWADWPDGEPSLDFGGDWGGAHYSAWEAAHDEARRAQQMELESFLRDHVRAPVVVVCDADWHFNPAVAFEAFRLRGIIRELGVPCAVAAPPRVGLKGSDDYLANGGSADHHVVIEPRESPALANWLRDYVRTNGYSMQRASRPRLERDAEIMRWYATHAIAEGFVDIRAASVGRMLGVSAKTVKRATQELARAGGLEIRGSRVVIADVLRPSVEELWLGGWLRRQK
jgi:hypothetical protein